MAATVHRVWSWRQAFMESRLESTTKLVLHTLASHMNEVGENCFPSVARIGQEASLSKRAVITHLEKAEACGWLRVSVHGYSGQRWRRNQYHPLVPDGFELAKGGERRAPPSAKGGEPHDQKVVNDVHLSSPGNSPEESLYANIRAEFPKRKGAQRKQDALKHLRARLREGHTPEAIMAGVRRYAAYIRSQGKEGTEFVQQIATFLGRNQGFLEDWDTGKPEGVGKQGARDYSDGESGELPWE